MRVDFAEGAGTSVLYQSDFLVSTRVIEFVREKLAKRGYHRAISADDDLGEIGMSSLDMVGLMLRVEVEYDLQIPEAEMTIENFRSVKNISRMVTALLPKS